MVSFLRVAMRIVLTSRELWKPTYAHMRVSLARRPYNIWRERNTRHTCPTSMSPDFLRFDHGVYTTVMSFFLLPSMLLALHSCAQSSISASGIESQLSPWQFERPC